jgi:hypothetical protein
MEHYPTNQDQPEQSAKILSMQAFRARKNARAVGEVMSHDQHAHPAAGTESAADTIKRIEQESDDSTDD